MSESYPYFSIAKKYGVSYGHVFELVNYYEAFGDNERVLSLLPYDPIVAAVRNAVIAEKARREKVIQQNSLLINNLSTSELS